MIVSETPHIRMINGDSLEAMKGMEDNAYELAIVDPEYREQNDPTQQMRKKGDMSKWQGKSDINFFNELGRVSQNRIIWGGNYYTDFLEENNNWIVWHKNNAGTGFSMAELAWCSIRKNVQVVSIRAPQTLQHEGARIHPTQKPVALYKWLLTNYATEGDRILDTHGGSGSICIACYDMGFDLDWYETDEDYYADAVKRFQEHKSQGKLFTPKQEYPRPKQLEIGGQL